MQRPILHLRRTCRDARPKRYVRAMFCCRGGAMSWQRHWPTHGGRGPKPLEGRAAAAHVGCCVVVCRPISSSHAVMRPSTLSLPAPLPINCLPPPPPPPPPLPPGRAATTATATTVVELYVVHWRRKRDDLLVDKAGTKTCYYSSGGALDASRHLADMHSVYQQTVVAEEMLICRPAETYVVSESSPAGLSCPFHGCVTRPIN